MKLVHLRDRLFAEAGVLGFPYAGVAPAVFPPPARRRYGDWLSRGFAADMDYLAHRRDFQHGLESVLPGARSVLMLALPYGPRPLSPPPVEPCGRVSLYARGRDYHRIFEAALKKLAAIVSEAGFTARGYVDHGPLPERTLAVEAGLGQIGRNACLIRPGAGSYLFLGALLSTAELSFSSPIAGDPCAGCRRCVKACPTGALSEDGFVDSRLCLSYHTVENRGEIPEPLKARMGRWVLGCDLCQMVCPHNRLPPPVLHPDLAVERLPAQLPLKALFDLDEAGFRALYSGSAAMRPGYAGMRRNASVAASNLARKQPFPRGP